MKNKKISMLWYRITKLAAGFVSKFIFGRKFVRNEIKGVKGPYVIIGNHQASLDFVNIMGATRRPITFVTSNAFYNTLPVKGIMTKIGVIPKQQFQTGLAELKRMKGVVDDGGVLCLYPSGLMSEDGLSTPIPTGTYKFLKWIKADIYVARTYGMYFAMPKWSKGMRKGRTYLDIYKLFSKEEVAQMDLSDIKKKVDEAILFDAYREQEKYLVRFKHNNNIEGLQNVLYMCPHCKSEYSMNVRDKSILYCDKCGFEQECDKYGFMHNTKGIGEEIRYVSDWSKLIYDELREKIVNGGEISMTSGTKIHMINYDEKKFVEVGNGQVSLDRSGFKLDCTINGKNTSLDIPISAFASLPFKPGKYIELQQGENIYRLVLDDGGQAMKYVNTVEILYEINSKSQLVK
ncbi:MAG: 1-acyl-sn-glycerol-3-phosphate acyltransferase [Clostridia bacterium]|nr:1-acyl-sn-glycerol-3-phosphate acyltransferase [Clostridia bacterium]